MLKLTKALLCSFILASSAAFAETVHVPIGQQGLNRQYLEKPKQGMTKTQVEQKFGEPRNWEPPVGDPPISRWIYDGFTVYFEYDHVIHSVSVHSPVN